LGYGAVRQTTAVPPIMCCTWRKDNTFVFIKKNKNTGFATKINTANQTARCIAAVVGCIPISSNDFKIRSKIRNNIIHSTGPTFPERRPYSRQHSHFPIRRILNHRREPFRTRP
jgi:hypothetical protein